MVAGMVITVYESQAVINSSDRQPDINLDLIEEPPEGYYAFVESPSAEPPKVRRPPYVQSDMECPGKIFDLVLLLLFFVFHISLSLSHFLFLYNVKLLLLPCFL